jgi:hypothetical protein
MGGSCVFYNGYFIIIDHLIALINYLLCYITV